MNNDAAKLLSKDTIMRKISIVIINYNSGEYTTDCLNSLYETDIEDNKLLVIIIDNGSLNEDVTMVKNYISEFNRDIKRSGKNIQFTLIENGENLGFSKGNNIGIKYALHQGEDYIIILNNDTVVDKHFIREIVKTANSNEKIGIISPKIYFSKGNEYHKEKYKENEKGKVIWYAGGIMDWKNIIGSHRGVDEVDVGQYDRIGETDFATGCCMLINKNLFDRIGYFNEKYFLYYEDNDFSQRAKKAGFKIVFTPSAIVWHKNAGSAGGSGSGLQDYYITRNRLLLGFNYAPIKSKISLFRESIKLLIKGRINQKKGVIDFYLSRFGKGKYAS